MVPHFKSATSAVKGSEALLIRAYSTWNIGISDMKRRNTQQSDIPKIRHEQET